MKKLLKEFNELKAAQDRGEIDRAAGKPIDMMNLSQADKKKLRQAYVQAQKYAAEQLSIKDVPKQAVDGIGGVAHHRDEELEQIRSIKNPDLRKLAVDGMHARQKKKFKEEMKALEN